MTLRDIFEDGFTDPKSNAIYCEKIANDYAIKFALFLSLNCETNEEKDGWWFYRNEWKTTNEILEIFKKEKGL